MKVKIIALLIIFSCQLLVASPSTASPTWFKPLWDKTVTKSTEIEVRNKLHGGTMFWVGVPTALATNKVGCANVTYVLGPSYGIGPADETMKQYAQFEVYAWSPLGQSLGSLTLEGRRGDFAPTPMTITTQKICIPGAITGSKNEVLLKMKAGIRILGPEDIVSLSDITIQLNVPSTIMCVKGKDIKKVISVKPKCPKGYKKK